MSVKVTRGPMVASLIGDILKRQKQALAEAISDAKTEIVARTSSGKDVTNKTFAKYTPQYADFKKSKGRKISPPDLTFTGEMLSSMRTAIYTGDTDKNITQAVISFGDSKNGKKALGNMKKRNFFDLSEKQIEKIKKRIAGA